MHITVVLSKNFLNNLVCRNVLTIVTFTYKLVFKLIFDFHLKMNINFPESCCIITNEFMRTRAPGKYRVQSANVGEQKFNREIRKQRRQIDVHSNGGAITFARYTHVKQNKSELAIENHRGLALSVILWDLLRCYVHKRILYHYNDTTFCRIEPTGMPKCVVNL